jgi:hypothetical protein
MANQVGYEYKEVDGVIIIQNPIPDETLICQYPAEQIGVWARVAFRDPKAWIGKDIHCCTDKPSVKELAETLSDVTGKKFGTLDITREQYYQLPLKTANPEMWRNGLVFIEE